ncbi:MAG: UDP-N-acetylglucosamine 1-carboxyvinyltransferase [Bacilli bacterium]|nr:UDP-N-acetylglucosamine 1-carboxyvinyltransferase [Bacilli bacterium]MDY5996139.1 UDP-N-acetylglucosamine 1-carboxyvinyltransferase [Bacilli bacterium]
MTKIKIEGGHKLTGEIQVSGAKNSAVALIPAAILCDEEVKITNVPNISDVNSLEEILNYLNAKIIREENEVTIDSSHIINKEIPEEMSQKLRASYYFMSSLLGKYKHVEMYFPGGCSIGERPIDQTLKGYRALGATVVEEGNRYVIDAKELKAANIYLDMPSVGATINIMLVAVKAKGTTIIENVAKEPEIVNVATFLNNMGAKIIGAGTNKIKITGVEYLHKSYHEVIPDRIEAGTFVIIGSLLGENLRIKNIIPSHIESLTSKLIEAGVNLKIGEDYIYVNSGNKYKAINIKTLPYPGFPTDLQQPIIPFLTQCHGTSTVEETIYENRFQNIYDTNRMGASIIVKNNKIAKVKGITPLQGKNVTATDLRGGASMLICGLIANGTTTIDNVKYILRGYDDICGKLTKVGAKIELI